MSQTIQPEIVSRELIKPTQTVPNHPGIHTFSFLDQFGPLDHVPLIYFYTDEMGQEVARRTSTLKASLATILSRWYPLAGRIRPDNGSIIDCNDEGVLFLEARIGCRLSEFLNNKRDENIELLLPDDLQQTDANLVIPLVVQVTVFECRGVALSACILHKLLDFAGICSFINNWAAMIRSSVEDMPTPEFNFSTLYPPLELSINQTQVPGSVESVGRPSNCACKRLCFSASNIAKLKSLVEHQVQNPTRVELVTALICKHVMAATRTTPGLSKSLAIAQAVNLRPRVSPSHPQTLAGNFSGIFLVVLNSVQESGLELCSFVKEMRQQKTEYFKACRSASSGQEFCFFVLETFQKLIEFCSRVDLNVYVCSSWCRFPIYEVDFGWGRPAWFTTARRGVKPENIIIMTDTREDDGIEVILTMKEQDMALFERDEELLAFATIN